MYSVWEAHSNVQCWSNKTWLTFHFLNGPFPTSFSLFLSFQSSWQQMTNIIFPNDWIRTTDLWNWKWPLYQLSDNHFPNWHFLLNKFTTQQKFLVNYQYSILCNFGPTNFSLWTFMLENYFTWFEANSSFPRPISYLVFMLMISFFLPFRSDLNVMMRAR